MDRQQKVFQLNDMKAVYIISEEGRVSFTILPENEETLFLDKITDNPLVQVSCTGDSSCPGFSAGETRHNSGLTMSFTFVSQEIVDDSHVKKIITTVKADNGLLAKHILIAKENVRSYIVYTELINESTEEITVEAMSSVNITGLTPFAEDEGRDRLLLHRFRSRWSEEGRHETRTIEDLLLEPSWANFAVRCEKFGAIGSMPVRGYFPFAAIEDVKAKVTWAVTNACSSSWQFELVRSDKNLSIACGLADFEFGHWRKKLSPKESFVSPESYITVVNGDYEKACDSLLDVQRTRLLDHQRVEELPAIFNEYCTTWGEPSQKRISEILSVINGDLFEYFVIDAGWYADSIKGWQDNMGDWKVAADLFPNGIKKVVEMINAAGMKAGIWFELEVVGKDADALEETDHLLTRDGKIIVSGTRRFWNMRSQWVNDYLTERVIDFLNENGFKYIKIDYNETIGIGCDGADSYGEGLRQSVEATKRFFRKIREKVPDIAIEICSSGGHRLEPGFMEIGDYLSFSDAHEEKEIPVIAADLHRLVLPQKSQIWAVLRADDSLNRIAYSICAGMLGLLCISGDVEKLSKDQWDLTKKGVSFYKKVSKYIVKGITKRYGPFQNSNRQLKDYQAAVRYSDKYALAVIHAFDFENVKEIEIPLEKDFVILDKYETGNHDIRIENGVLKLQFSQTFDATAILLKVSEN